MSNVGDHLEETPRDTGRGVAGDGDGEGRGDVGSGSSRQAEQQSSCAWLLSSRVLEGHAWGAMDERARSSEHIGRLEGNWAIL